VRIGIGGIHHETNQLLHTRTGERDFVVVRALDELVATTAGLRTYLTGMVDTIREVGATPVALLYAVAPPSGTIDGALYQSLKKELLDALRAGLPLDGVVLDLHGAAVAEEVDDVEGDLCSAVRDLVGPDVPVVATHDLHGNTTLREIAALDVLLGTEHYPHHDAYERGQEAVRALVAIHEGRLRPTAHLERLPLLLPPTTTYSGIGAEMVEVCRRAETIPGVVDCTFMHGFPYTDNPHVGAHVLVTTNDDAALAAHTAREVAGEIWRRRTEFMVEHVSAEEAVRRAMASPDRPVVINDTSDNPGGGTPGDGTHLLRALLAAGATRVAVSTIADAEVAAAAHRAGVGASIDVELGGKTDPMYGTPVVCRAEVKALTDGAGTPDHPLPAAWPFPLGPSALLTVDGVDVVVCSQPTQTVDPTPLLLHGVDPLELDVVVVKSSGHFRAGFAGVAAAIITADPPGMTTSRLSQLPPRTHAPWPLYPLDEATAYPVPAEVSST